MGNDLRGEVSIEIGGKRRRMKFTLNSLREAQQALGMKGGNDILGALARLDFQALQMLLWLSLKHEEKDLTFEQVGGWDMHMKDVSISVGKALHSAFGVDEKKD